MADTEIIKKNIGRALDHLLCEIPGIGSTSQAQEQMKRFVDALEVLIDVKIAAAQKPAD